MKGEWNDSSMVPTYTSAYSLPTYMYVKQNTFKPISSNTM